MDVRLSTTFQNSLAKLNNDEQKQTKISAMDLQLNPSNPGLQFHKLDRSRDPNFCSIRVSRDIRIILHKSKSTLLLCYVDHHDDAYKWAERRKMEQHPKTGAPQIVEIRELVVEIERPVYIDTPAQAVSKPLLFERFTDDEILGFGVPLEWLPDVKRADEDNILDIATHLPEEAAEAVLEIATGNIPEPGPIVLTGSNPFDHPDAQRRFRLMEDVEELALALDYPWEKWTTFLHPVQRKLVERSYNGPARVSGSAGTGKTIVALHRAAWLAKQYPDSRILLTTFSDALANNLDTKLKQLLSAEPRIIEQIDIEALDSVALRLYTAKHGVPELATEKFIDQLLAKSAEKIGSANDFNPFFIKSEWKDVVDTRQLTSWEQYRDVPRLGRKVRLSETKRRALWNLFSHVLDRLKTESKITQLSIYHQLTDHYQDRPSGPYDYIIVDEAQDIGIPQLQWLATMGSTKSTACSSLAIWGNVSSNRPFPGKPVVSISEDAQEALKLTTERHTKYVIVQTGYSTQPLLMSMGILNIAKVPFQCLTVPSLASRLLRMRQPKLST